MIKTVLLTTIAASVINIATAQESLQKLYPVNFADVNITDGFWKPRMDKVATATLFACIDYTENKTGRIRNFEKAAKRSGKHEGIYFDDSDVYKALEAMAYSLRNHPDATIEKKADEWIDKISAAQLPDGYLDTYYILTGLDKRWSDMEKHEDYCAGHLIEAGIAYYNTTGKDKLLNTAMRFANNIDSTFRLQNRHWVSGHQEIELALMRLYHLTKQERYLQLAQWYLEQRGHGYGKGVIWDDWKDPAYCQDKVPVKDQREITGHAVRAMYMYTGAADVAAVTNDQGYVTAMNAIWDDVINRNMYITGGIGAQGKNEGFGVDYDLPNESAYCETCASVGMVLWNQRMNMLTGNARYIDVLERSLYNGALDGLSLSGDHFFYGNPLASSGNYTRREWFGTACCPSNIARLVASLGNYIYAVSNNAAWVNLYIGSNTKLKINNQEVGLNMQTGYPWSGDVSVKINVVKKQAFQLRLRVPGWLTQPVPGDLYHYQNSSNTTPVIKVNNENVTYKMDNGYAVIDRSWKNDDVVSINFPMQVQQVLSNPALQQNSNRVALQYGPLVYCVESTDNGNNAWNILVPSNATFKTVFQPQLMNGINTIDFTAKAAVKSSDGLSITMQDKNFTAIPYYAWSNRGDSEMQVWLPTAVDKVKINY